ncbi:SGNH hydrolase-type esterase domain-containing protein, partial [Massariosphaeria phaeospora]
MVHLHQFSFWLSVCLLSSEKHFVNSLPSSLESAFDRVAFPRQAADDDSLSPDIADLSYIRNFAAVGDSYAAGIGAGVRDDAACARYYDAYPRLINRDGRLGNSWRRNFQFAACSGHTSRDVTLLQIPGLDRNVDAMTISAGGNDVGLTQVLNDCIYGWLAPPQEKCNQTLEETENAIRTVLPQNLDNMLAWAKSRLRPRIGRAYYVNYAKFFSEADTQCDSVSWSWYQSQLNDNEKLYLTLEKRQRLNALVQLTNEAISAAVERAGDQVIYVDVNQYYEIWGGRFCEKGVTEPDPNNDFLLFFERETGEGEFPFRAKMRRDNSVEEELGDVPEGTFEAQIVDYIEASLRMHPDWIEDLETAETQALDNTTSLSRRAWISWLIRDQDKRVFHPRPNGHAIIAMNVLYHME